MIEHLPKEHLYYLASPYSKYPGGLERAFKDICIISADLVRRGYAVFSPIAHTHPIAIQGGLNPLDHSLWLPFDEPMMRACTAIAVAMLPGWKDSYGVDFEIKQFKAMAKPEFYLRTNVGSASEPLGAAVTAILKGRPASE